MALGFLKSLDADDIFISYSRDDGEAYLTGLDAALSNGGFSCFTDKRGTDANKLPPATLFEKIRLCKTLVLLATPGALSSPENIMPEVQEFAEANGTSRIIAVSFDRKTESSASTPIADWSNSPWYRYVEGKSREREDPNALKTGEPSPFVVNSIVKASDYMKSKDRLLRYRNRALMGFLGLLVAGLAAGGFAVYGFIQAKNARSEAQVAIDQAKDTRIRADATIAKANLDAVTAVDQAQKDIRTAQETAQREIQKAKEDAQKEIQNLAAEKRKLAAEIQKSQDKIDATYIRLNVAAFNTQYAISHIAPAFGSKSAVQEQQDRLKQMEGKLSGAEVALLRRLTHDEKFAREIADITVTELKHLTGVLSSLSGTDRIVKLEMDPMEARTPDGRTYKLEAIKTAGDPQLLKWFRTKPRGR
jgi:hypothetical protein